MTECATGGDICYPQLGLKLAYEPGTTITFRGAELEHFVADWCGFRVFVLFTNHQPVRNWADRRTAEMLGQAIPPTGVERQTDEKEWDDDYDPCVQEDIEFSDEEEALTSQDMHGPAWWDPARNWIPVEQPRFSQQRPKWQRRQRCH